MRLASSLVLFIVLATGIISNAFAQDTSNASQTATDLRSQLRDVQAREAELQNRAKQLDEDLKPENIERSLAGIGSTRPEELREMRRRQLSIERDSVRSQLSLVVTSRERLESVIRTADSQSYQQSAQGSTLPLSQMLGAQYSHGPRWLIAMLAGVIATIGIVLVITALRRAK